MVGIFQGGNLSLPSKLFRNDMRAFVSAMNVGTAGILFLFIKGSEIIVQQTTDYGTKKKSRTGRNL